MPVDEIKIQERLRWDLRTNMILGICREHGGKCSLEFRSITQADFVVDCLNAGQVHFAAEVNTPHLVYRKFSLTFFIRPLS